MKILDLTLIDTGSNSDVGSMLVTNNICSNSKGKNIDHGSSDHPIDQCMIHIHTHKSARLEHSTCQLEADNAEVLRQELCYQGTHRERRDKIPVNGSHSQGSDITTTRLYRASESRGELL